MSDHRTTELDAAMHRVMRHALRLAEECGELLAIVQWCEENSGERLIDHPHVLALAQAAIAKAEAP